VYYSESHADDGHVIRGLATETRTFPAKIRTVRGTPVGKASVSFPLIPREVSVYLKERHHAHFCEFDDG
jgi:hypothetical protein